MHIHIYTQVYHLMDFIHKTHKFNLERPGQADNFSVTHLKIESKFVLHSICACPERGTDPSIGETRKKEKKQPGRIPLSQPVR